jgi:hypothetical protein
MTATCGIHNPINYACILGAFAGALLTGTSLARAADVTYERLVNPEPQNWLSVHHDYYGQRYSALDTINKTNVRNMRLLFAVALGGTSTNESLEATPLVDDGFMYMVDAWGIVSKIDVRSGASGQILWQMNPKLEKQDRNRGLALWNDLVISVTGYEGRVFATDKESGKVVWDKNLLDQPDLELTAAPLALKDAIMIGGSGGDRGLRNWVASLDPKSGDIQWKTYSIPAPGEPGNETWKAAHAGIAHAGERDGGVGVRALTRTAGCKRSLPPAPRGFARTADIAGSGTEVRRAGRRRLPSARRAASAQAHRPRPRPLRHRDGVTHQVASPA